MNTPTKLTKLKSREIKSREGRSREARLAALIGLSKLAGRKTKAA